MNSVKKETGSFLIFTLWVMLILSIFSLAISTQVRQRLKYIQSIENRQILRQTADFALQRTLLTIQENNKQNSPSGYSSLWSSSAGNFKQQEVGSALYTVSHYVGDYDAILYGADDEGSKLDINKVKSLKTLERLIKHAAFLGDKESADLAAAIFDWRDEDESLNAGGAESREYRSKTPPYKSKNLSFETLEELLLVHGMNRDTFVLLKPHLTLYGANKKNINFISESIMRAYGMSDGLVRAIHRFRKGKDEVFGTEDDGIFTSKENALDTLEQSYSLGSAERQSFEDYLNSGFFNFKSVIFRVNIIARIKYRRESLSRSCVISKFGKVYSCQSDFFSIDRSEIKELQFDEEE